MKRVLLSLLIVSFFSTVVFSQAYEGTIEYTKKKQQAFVIDYPYPPEAAENAIIKKMEDLGYKGKEEKGLFNKDKGFRVYKGAFITDIMSSSMDYAFKVEAKGRKDKDQSVVYLIIMKDGENAKAAFEAADTDKAKAFLNNLQPYMEAANLELQISNQDEVVVKAEKKLKDLKDDQADMEKKIKKLQEDLKDNAKDQDNQQKEIEAQKQALEALKSKRKS
ncbi:MAG: hypothetical protein JNN00_11665 [Chitinophagaceae bacterium]|nr:hypothetical protein [Chitinophagaceae bacterium]